MIEIGLLRTVLLETGNWADAGHPTGRRVSFVNSFAIEGHYFNFSTSGQWMWDELQLTLPADKDPYAVIGGLQKLVTKDTEENARKAEEEWQNTTTRYHVRPSRPRRRSTCARPGLAWRCACDILPQPTNATKPANDYMKRWWR